MHVAASFVIIAAAMDRDVCFQRLSRRCWSETVWIEPVSELWLQILVTSMPSTHVYMRKGCCYGLRSEMTSCWGRYVSVYKRLIWLSETKTMARLMNMAVLAHGRHPKLKASDTTL